MHETLIVLLPLLAGYWFTQCFALTQILSQRFDGYHRLWFTAGFAVLFACVGRLTTSFLHWIPMGRDFEQFWFLLFPPHHFAYSGSATAAALLGAGASCLLLCWRSASRTRPASQPARLFGRFKTVVADPFEGYAWAAHILQDHLVDLLIETTRRKGFVMVTLDNRKVYLGAVIRYPALFPDRAYLGLLPAYSGFRRPDNFRVEWTVDYTSVWTGNNADFRLGDLLVVIPTDRIHTAQSYDPGPGLLQPGAARAAQPRMLE
jgi:hypothetical protein